MVFIWNGNLEGVPWSVRIELMGELRKTPQSLCRWDKLRLRVSLPWALPYLRTD